MTFDEESAQVSGIPVRLLTYIFLVLVSMTISVSLKAIGAILVFAMIVTPAAAAYQLTFKFNRLLLLAGFFGVFATVGGLYLSVVFNLPSGSTIVTLITLVFLISFIISPKRRLAHLAHLPTECPYCGKIIDEGFCDDPECLQSDMPHSHVSHDDHRRGDVVIDKRKLPEKAPSNHGHEGS